MVTIPKEIQAGLSVVISGSFTDYPASSWSANLYLRGAASKLDVVGVADGDGFVFSLSAAQSGALADGLYSAVVRVDKAGDVYQPVTERLTVLPNVAIMDTYDPRTHNEKALAAIQATLANRAGSDQLKLSFNGRSLEKTPVVDLLKMESSYIKKVGAERRKKSGAGIFKVSKVRLP